MSSIDWKLVIGYACADAEEYLEEEGISYRLIHTKPPQKQREQDGSQELRVIAVRTDRDPLEVICAPIDWTIS